MSKRIFILTVPGIGTINDDYIDEFEAKMQRYAKGTKLQGNYEIFKTRPFAETGIDARQDSLFNRLKQANELGGILSLREFVLKSAGDGVTFECKEGTQGSNYLLVQAYLKQKIEELNLRMQACSDPVLVAVAGSMGAHLLSSYIKDADSGSGIFAGAPATAQNNLRNLRYLASLGCNIPLFVSGYREEDIKAFDRRNSAFEWDNYYDRDDVLGWPLKQLSPSYTALVNDHEINTGAFVGSHMRYWQDKNFVKPFTAKLCGMMR